MRARQLKLVVTFHTTTSAMAMEKHCMQKGIPGRLIPVPRDITAGCGMAWCAPIGARNAIEFTAKAARIETAGYYEIMV